ncbi:MAG: amidohydrolase family protein [Candidatus Hydrogenedentes bacterium]|nr:amidohydrolase family protein [Candidatus Hydrogenedentota bacterium]
MGKKERLRRQNAGKRNQAPANRPGKSSTSVFTWLILLGITLAGAGIGHRAMEAWQKEEPPPPRVVEEEGPVFTAADYAKPALSLAEIQAQKLIIDVHEHIQSLNEAPIYIDEMDQLGIGKMCLMGSSWFTITLNEGAGFSRWQENNTELIKIIKQYPDRFEAWPTLDPMDPEALDHFKEMVAQGATGLKLYIGHGYVTKANKYMFHTMAMDDPRMLPIYAYCQENYIPICMHVNPFREKPGFAQELIAVLTAYPDLKFDIPHFILSSIASDRLREFLDTFPNINSNVSFGDAFANAGLKRISDNPEKFQRLFRDYPDRFMYATDLVLTNHPSKTREWVRSQFQAYLDMLSKKTYTASFIRGETLNGLELPPWLLEKVLYKNYEEFKARRPKGTVITRKINWDYMNQDPVDREPGQAFPPPPPKKKKPAVPQNPVGTKGTPLMPDDLL